MRLPDGDGLDLVEWIQTHKPQTPVAVITAHGNVETAVRALKLGAFDFISKPLDVAALRKLIAATLKLGESSESTLQLPQVKLLGRSRAMEQLREMIERVARSQAPVHIYGESGTGKELVAHLIHDAGARRDGPFVPVNCGAIPDRADGERAVRPQEGQLHRRGRRQAGPDPVRRGRHAVPGRDRRPAAAHAGQAAARDPGEERAPGRRVAGRCPIDVRILSATHKNLAALVAEGKFREDLFYRVNVIEIRVPPLRERLEDIDELVRFDHRPPRPADRQPLAAGDRRRARERCASITSPATCASWRTCWSAPRRCARTASSTPATCSCGRRSRTPKCRFRTRVAPGEKLGDALEDIERDAIVRALEQTRYNKTKAAQLLGMTFRSLRYRIKKLGIE